MQKKIDLDMKKKKIVASLTPSFKPLLVATNKVDSSPALAPRIPVWQRLHDDAKKKCHNYAHEEKSLATQPKKSVVDADKRIDRLYRQGVEKERKRQSLPKVCELSIAFFTTLSLSKIRKMLIFLHSPPLMYKGCKSSN